MTRRSIRPCRPTAPAGSSTAGRSTSAASPRTDLSLVLFVEPRGKRREIVIDRTRVDVVFAGECRQLLGPRSGTPHFQHRVEFGADFLVAEDVAAIERALPTRQTAGRAVELEFIDLREEVARVGRVVRDMEFCAGIEGVRRSWFGRRQPLVFLDEIPPRVIVMLRRNRARKDAP